MRTSKRLKTIVGGGVAAGALLLTGPAVVASATPVTGGDIAIRGGGAFANGEGGGAGIGGAFAKGEAGGGYLTGSAGGKWFREFRAACDAEPTMCGAVAETPDTSSTAPVSP